MSGLISLLITLFILALIGWGLFWLIDAFIKPPTPNLIFKAIVVLIGILYLLGLLGGVAPYPTHWYRGP
jgi:hypothetical protein